MKIMKTVTTKQFFSDDGKEFQTESDCLDYEFNQKIAAAGLTDFTRQELTIGKGLTTIDHLPFQAPWMNALGSCFVNVYEVKRENGVVKFGVGNEKPPVLVWVDADDFYDEWPK
jgi:hypothetical protein